MKISVKFQRVGAAALVLVLAALSPLSACANLDWNWRMPGEIYKNLNFEARTGVDRASKAFSSAFESERRGASQIDLIPRYRAAVYEWRKVEIQAEAENSNDDLLAYAAFMQGYSRLRARDTNEAIKFFNQVIDLYEEITWISFPARYFIALSRLRLGEMKSGWAMFTELLNDEEAQDNPLMADIANRLGWKYWGELKEADAQRVWSVGAAAKFANTYRNAYSGCREGLLEACVVRGDFDALEDYLFSDVKDENVKRKAAIIKDNVNWFTIHVNHWNSGIRKYFSSKYKSESERNKKFSDLRRNYVQWYESKKSIVSPTNDHFWFDLTVIRLRMGLDSREQTLAKVSKAGASIKKNGDAKDVSSRVNSVVSFYYELGDFTAALIVADKMPTPRAQAHLRYEICRRGAECGKMKWDECLAHLKEYMDTKPEAHEMMNAKYTMAGILRDRMGDAKKALAIYTEINDPPRSLWELVTTYRRLGEKRKAENILQEIASIFERDAPRAILTLAQFCEADGDKKKAIALYRRLLSQPEWKKTGESSQAHQALERLGERTGGAMINEVR